METLYAIIVNGVVVNVIVADETFIAENHPEAARIDHLDPHPGIGWTYDGSTFTAPPLPLPPPEPKTTDFTRFGFRSLFTFDELVLIDNYDTQTAVALTTDQKMTLKTIMKNFDAAQDIDVTDPATVAGVNTIAVFGLLTQERADTILRGDPPPSA